jgi:hypothetical protein
MLLATQLGGDAQSSSDAAKVRLLVAVVTDLANGTTRSGM